MARDGLRQISDHESSASVSRISDAEVCGQPGNPTDEIDGDEPDEEG